MLTTQIESARHEARVLYTELEKTRSLVKDTGLVETAAKVAAIPNHSINPRLYHTLAGHQSKISRIQWASRHTLLSACQDGYMILWDAVTGYKKNAIELENSWVLTCAVSPGGDTVVSGGLDNNLTVYLLNNRKNTVFGDTAVQYVFKGHRAYISDCKFLNPHQVITVSGDMKACMWDLNKGGQIRSFVDHTGDILCMDTFGKDANMFVTASCDGYCKIWDLRSKQPTQSLFISNSDINTVRVFPQGQSFVTGSDDSKICLFDLRSDCELAKYSIVHQLSDDKRSSVLSVDSVLVLLADFSRSGRLIYACYSDFGCMIWDTLKAEMVGSLGTYASHVSQVAVSPDGMAVATSSWDSAIRVWAP